LQIQDKAFRDIGTLVSFGLSITFKAAENSVERRRGRAPIKKTARKTRKKRAKA
jgi:hypothetical protein